VSERDFPTLRAPGGVPKIHSIFDFTAEALGQLRLWLEMNPPSIPVDQVLGFNVARSAVRVYSNAAISVPNITATALTFNAEATDTDTIHDTGANTSRLVCRTAGKYLAWGNVEWATGAGNVRSLGIVFNGTTVVGSDVRGPVAGGNITTQTVTSNVLDLVVGDYIELVAYQDSGGALNVNYAGAYSPQFAMIRVN
jgi:hypothetical protein